jgi:hypothetical protein
MYRQGNSPQVIWSVIDTYCKLGTAAPNAVLSSGKCFKFKPLNIHFDESWSFVCEQLI